MKKLTLWPTKPTFIDIVDSSCNHTIPLTISQRNADGSIECKMSNPQIGDALLVSSGLPFSPAFV